MRVEARTRRCYGVSVGLTVVAATLQAPGGMAERPNARLLKSLGMQVPGGSNPSPSARFPSVDRTDRLVGQPAGREAAGHAAANSGGALQLRPTLGRSCSVSIVPFGALAYAYTYLQASRRAAQGCTHPGSRPIPERGAPRVTTADRQEVMQGWTRDA
jgi:hypothetical protein